MYASLQLPWSDPVPPPEQVYRDHGLVKTAGTIFVPPPSEAILRETFDNPPRPKTRMSSGAVALCKHFERGGASSEHQRHHPFWTLPRGSNENKTEMARRILDDMLLHAVWKNVMLLHPGVAVYEIRNALGYGMRWTLDVEAINKGDGLGDGCGHGHGQSHVDGSGHGDLVLVKEWMIVKTTFRGFLEPILGLDHELNEVSIVQGPGTRSTTSK